MNNNPESGVAYIKPSKKIVIRLEPSKMAQILEFRSFGEYIIYDNIITNENKLWLCFMSKYGKSYTELNSDLLAIGPIPDGEYIIETLINDNYILDNSKKFKNFNNCSDKNKYFYFKFDPIDGNYTISNLENFLGVDNNFDIQMSKDYNCQKWKIHIINDAENVYRIENQILFKDLTIKDNKLILKKYNNSINLQFYL